MTPWREVERLGPSPVFEHGELTLLTLSEEHLYLDGVTALLPQVSVLDDHPPGGIGRPEAVIYASRHRSAAGRKALTVHPIGNFAAADFGGGPGQLPPPPPAPPSAPLPPPPPAPPAP